MSGDELYLAHVQLRVDALETIATLSIQALDHRATRRAAVVRFNEALSQLWAIAEDLR